MLKTVFVFAALTATAAPAFADEYYVVRGPDRDCRVVETRPVEKTYVQVGPVAFATREEAEKQVTVLCKDEQPDARVIIRKD